MVRLCSFWELVFCDVRCRTSITLPIISIFYRGCFKQEHSPKIHPVILQTQRLTSDKKIAQAIPTNCRVPPTVPTYLTMSNSEGWPHMFLNWLPHMQPVHSTRRTPPPDQLPKISSTSYPGPHEMLATYKKTVSEISQKTVIYHLYTHYILGILNIHCIIYYIYCSTYHMFIQSVTVFQKKFRIVFK